MIDLAEECLAILNGGHFQIIDPGPLHTPVQSFSIKRDETLRLILETDVAPDATSQAVDHPPGTVRMTTEQVLLHSLGGLDGELVGVIPYSLKTLSTGATEQAARELTQVHIAKTNNPRGAPAAYVIDWLENLPSSPFVWPAVSRMTSNTTSKRAIALEDGITITRDCDSYRSSHNTAKLVVNGRTFYVCALDRDDQPTALRPGCIVFDGTPDDLFRKEVRTALSFALGLYVVELGTSHYVREWIPVATVARSGYSLGRRAFGMGPEQLAPLGPRFLNELNAAQLTRAVTAYVAAYETLDLANLSWAYWHACAATPHIAPAHFGAAIEALQSAYIKSRPGVIATDWAPRGAWRKLRGDLVVVIDGASLPAEAKEALKGKLATLNKTDQRPRLKAVMAALGLRLGRDEDDAWRRRNKAAHGEPTRDGEELATIRDTKLLKGLFHRMLLRMTGAADQYIDYASPHFNYRPLGDPPPDLAQT